VNQPNPNPSLNQDSLKLQQHLLIEKMKAQARAPRPTLIAPSVQVPQILDKKTAGIKPVNVYENHDFSLIEAIDLQAEIILRDEIPEDKDLKFKNKLGMIASLWPIFSAVWILCQSEFDTPLGKLWVVSVVGFAIVYLMNQLQLYRAFSGEDKSKNSVIRIIIKRLKNLR
jgi:hypothetical protein